MCGQFSCPFHEDGKNVIKIPCEIVPLLNNVNLK
jgi:hypothetical protein